MCEIRLAHHLPFISIELIYGGRTVELSNVLLDTGSGGSVFSADQLLEVGIRFEHGDPVHRIRGVGGTEFVFFKRVEAVALGGLRVENFGIEVGAMDYGFEIDGLLGMDFLLQIGAVLDLGALRVQHGRVGR